MEVGGGGQPPTEPGITTTGELSVTRGATLRGQGHFAVSSSEIQAIKNSGNPRKMAQMMHDIIRDDKRIFIPNDAVRLERMEELLEGMNVDQIDGLRRAYIDEFGKDPEIDIRSWDLFQPFLSHDDGLELELTAALTGPRHLENARSLAGLLEKAQSGTLTMEDRKEYYSLMPMVGLWNAPLRPDAEGKDAMERVILKRAWSEMGVEGTSLDAAMEQLEAGLPPADLTPKAPRDKSVAVIVSSAGAQWQELMDWLMVMDKEGIHVQLFTPNGRPVAFQHDSMTVNEDTGPLGFAAPGHLDPQGTAGEVAKKYLANTTGAANFDPEQFGAVFAAGGLGFNEDIAAAVPERVGLLRTRSAFTVNPNIASMMEKAIEARLPNIGICHGPTLYAAVDITVDGKTEPLNKGMKTGSLPPFEGYVGLTERKEPMFTYDVNTHKAMEESGGETSVLKDIADMSRVVVDHKDGLDLITGPGPQASRNLGYATLEVLQKRW
jgi:putative intracellular protease/amidase